ncbi:MFS transporter [Acrocarpospora catenulata]|uniref:MFS transporter n=1 Tax=Acrocarpospora catenulata TaxID=2836182 RepID=UPI001BDA5150|nr:MFS transporter [Acrocarpospora catenulata]
MPAIPPQSAPSIPLRAAIRATYVVFAGCGFLLASWVARIPQLRDHLNMEPAQLGWVLLGAAAGALVSRPLSGPIVVRLGQRRTVTITGILASIGLVIVGLGDLTGLAVLVAGLLVIGFAAAAWDVAMNVQGTEVERALGRSIMPRFHAAFAAGTVVAAALGAAMVALQVPVAGHLTGVAVIVAVAVPLAARDYLPDYRQVDDHVNGPARGTLRAWREPRTILVGLFVLAFAFGEGAANDWIAVALIDDHGAAEAVGAIGFSIFLAAVTVVRWFGAHLLDRYGRVLVLRVLGVTTIVGLLLFIFGPNLPIALLGAVLWGMGTAFGYPVGMSAGADDPRHAAARVTVISTVGKLAAFTGPPLIGWLGNHVTVLRALLVVVVLQGVALLIAGATKPLQPEPDDPHLLGR